ncbi:GNAT family N-acetyltransferase [Rhizobium sp. ARZ01]|uniref:GNAT family N-acetyltransferase n=1 Tax=Rhizobium sp. ARZ01 TaxID=2769313 RepID=UPI00177BFFC4|nr:GNAT family N-acetyltransferase [Rhizobium sp. ARZ01]MBD9374969.1 GNAT family N-acetyltransferase [Rhizobium sp. ARZ01]
MEKDRECLAMSLRVATTPDAEVVSALLAASYTFLMPAAYDKDVLALALPLMTVAKPDLLASGRFYLVEGPDRMLFGCGGWSPTAPDGSPLAAGAAHLRHFATHPDHLGEGIGRLIYEHCARAAAAVGITTFFVHASLNAEPFYASLGLERCALLHIPLTPGMSFPVAEMAGRLPPV